MTTTTRDSRRPFGERRALVLKSINDLREFRDGASRDQLESNPILLAGCAKLLELIGEITHPNAGHASQRLSDEYHAARHEIAHEYSTFNPDLVWSLMQGLDELYEEVLERTEPPERPSPEPP